MPFASRTSRHLSILFALAATVATPATWAAADNAQAAGSDGATRRLQAEGRARSNISAFPGHSLHGAGQSYALRDVIVDDDGVEHVRFDRHYQGLRVVGGELVVHQARGGSLREVSRTMERLPMLATRATLTPASATTMALLAHPGEPGQAAPELLVHARGDQPTLAYDVRVYADQPDGTPSEKHVIVDAHRGTVIDAWDDVHTASAAGTGKSYFNGVVALITNSLTGGYELRDPSRGGQYTINMRNRTSGGSVFTDADNVWGNGALSDTATVGVDAQYGTAVTWDYFKAVHGRNGIANNGAGAYNRVHYGSKYNNAFWSDSCFCMTYGDGDGVTFNPFTALDVAGHEMSHGVTSRTAGLIYSGESGGLNEATSDIFGTMVEYYANNGADAPDYQIGERLYRSGTGAIRYMYRPSLDGASADCWYSTVGALNVHYSSGVANHFYYLLAEGTTAGSPSPTCVAGNTKKASGAGTLAGIGRAKAEKIWYRALTVYMTASSKYASARSATLNAARDLYGSGSAEYNAVAAAWSAVLVN
ncbi:MAG TPA: M4 family metallopeptidase [Burkholderiaceae bacterium]|nr:M4 family metallopeptidase [Burkholderiaceae bacterium]HMX10740.1 M4 family metallopeptidase [Burkholderiaceae bacterium]HMY98664.1 M4 family metallopeptidase [Burkholderiaceae bacterium]HNG78938.1 M4 family metallopeptidase [Burkholderiaceae bacterium]